MKGTTKSRGQKDKLDRFYTKPDVAAALVRALLDSHPELSSAVFIEPSAGDGAFVYALEQDPRIDNDNVIAFDIAPSSSPICSTKIHENDFIEGDLEQALKDTGHADVADKLASNNQSIVFIGNPPFGEQAHLAISFVKNSLDNGRFCAFILPPSFRKESVQKKLSDFGALSELLELDETGYRVGEEEVDVPSCFFVFDSQMEFAPSPDRTKDVPFASVKKDMKHRSEVDFAVRRVGGTAGSATDDVASLSPESFFFYKKLDGCPDDIVDLINECDFPERDWSVGPRSLSSKEIAAKVFDKLVQRGDLSD